MIEIKDILNITSKLKNKNCYVRVYELYGDIKFKLGHSSQFSKLIEQKQGMEELLVNTKEGHVTYEEGLLQFNIGDETFDMGTLTAWGNVSVEERTEIEHMVGQAIVELSKKIKN